MVVDAVSEGESFGVRRCIVGRSGSVAGVVPVPAVDAEVVVESSEAVPSDERRFIVGLSGSSGGGDALLVDVELVDVLEVLGAVPELSRRFIVGRSGSSLEDEFVVLDALAGLFVWVVAGLL